MDGWVVMDCNMGALLDVKSLVPTCGARELYSYTPLWRDVTAWGLKSWVMVSHTYQSFCFS